VVLNRFILYKIEGILGVRIYSVKEIGGHKMNDLKVNSIYYRCSCESGSQQYCGHEGELDNNFSQVN